MNCYALGETLSPELALTWSVTIGNAYHSMDEPVVNDPPVCDALSKSKLRQQWCDAEMRKFAGER